MKKFEHLHNWVRVVCIIDQREARQWNWKGTTSCGKAWRHGVTIGYHFGLGWSGMEGAAVRGGRRARRWTVPSGSSWSSPGPGIDHTSEGGTYRPSFSSKGARWGKSSSGLHMVVKTYLLQGKEAVESRK